MKYYSEKTHKLYETAEAIADAEKVFDEKEEQRKAKEEEARREREAMRSEQESARKELDEAYKVYVKLRDAYDAKYGRGALADSANSLLEYLDNILGELINR